MPVPATGTNVRFTGGEDENYHFIDFEDCMEITGSVRSDLGEFAWREAVWKRELSQFWTSYN